MARNLLRPLFRKQLPNEMWMRIFLFCINSEEDSIQTTTTDRKVSAALRTAMKITHVCTRWRDVSLGCSEIWKRQFDFNMKGVLLKMILGRIGEFVKNIHFKIPRGGEEIVSQTGELWWASAMDQFETSPDETLLWAAYQKAIELDAVVTKDDKGFLVWEGIKERLPLLKRISLTFANTNQTAAGLLLRSQDLYDADKPTPWRLQTLELRRCFFSLDDSHLRGLQTLFATDLVGIQGACITPTDWLLILTEMKDLRSLTLIHSIDGVSRGQVIEATNPPTETTQPLRRVVKKLIMPSLEYLEVKWDTKNESHVGDCLEFLHRLETPDTCERKTSIPDDQPDIQDIQVTL